MAFSDFKSINMVIKKYPVKIRREKFLSDDITLAIPNWFMENLNFVIQNKSINDSEFFLCEVFIYPFLQEVWKKHTTMQLWSHQAICFNQELSGEPDYLFSSVTKEAVTHIINSPILTVVEAKKENFTEGWGQCLAEMIACQKINDNPDIIIFGIVTTGEFWRFGKLHGDTFTENTLPVSIENPSKIMGCLEYVMNECESQLQLK